MIKIITILSIAALIIIGIIATKTNEPVWAWLWMLPGISLVACGISLGLKAKSND